MNYFVVMRPLSKNIGIAGIAILLSLLLLISLDILTPISIAAPGMDLIIAVALFIGIAFVALGGTFFIPILIFEKQAFSRINRIQEEIGEIDGLDNRDDPPYFLIDSIDRSILQSVTELGGDIVAVEENMTSRALIPEGESQTRKLAQLHLLGLIAIPEKTRRIFLTPLGMDALNIPAAMFVSRIPLKIWEHLFQEKLAIWGKKWGNVVVETSKALEEMMVDKIYQKRNGEHWETVILAISKKPLEKWPAGQLLDALVKLGYVLEKSLEYNLANELVKIRNLVHAKSEVHTFDVGDADKCDTYIGLLAKSWYGPR